MRRSDPRNLLARISEIPHLAQVIPQLPPEVLHRVVQHCGLEDCAELVALATSEQLSAVFDLDLWRADRAGADEQLDPARFCRWLEVLVDEGVSAAAEKLARMDAALLIAGLASQIAVFDRAVFVSPIELTGADPVIDAAFERGLHRDVGGYSIIAKHTDSWDAIVGLLAELDEHHPDAFHRVMRGCRLLSNSASEIDGLHDLPGDSEQVHFDLAFARERRREPQGYVTPAQAGAFLRGARAVSVDADRAPWSRRPPAQDERLPLRTESQDGSSAALTEFIEVLGDAGLLPERNPPLLTGSGDPLDRASGCGADPEALLSRIQVCMRVVRARDPMVFSKRSEELAFLANVLAAGCPIQERPFTPREASDAAAAICNLGLENWPRRWLAPALDAAGSDEALLAHDLVSAFQVGWAVLYRDVVMFAARQLVTTIHDLRCSDREIEMGLYVLRRQLTRHIETGAPWRARPAFDVLALLDMPSWAALLALIAECPVMLANITGPAGSGVRSINPSEFQFISTRGHLAAVRDFMCRLPEALTS